MVVELGEEPEKVVLGNGDTLSERVSEIDLWEEEMCSTDEMRALLGL